jgi:S-formylglutathione hydrolase FrmB/cytochrome c2
VSSDLTTIKSSGTTSLLTDGTNYYLQTGDGPPVEVSYDGAPIVVGQFGAWTLIAAQQTASGYEIALKNGSADQYAVWDTDSSGNYVSSPISNVSGASAALESIEPSFNDDLNGDGIIGVPPASGRTVIESSGTTSLLTDGTDYFLQPAGGAAVELGYGGAPIVVGQFGAWTPIAAQQTATGYEIALKNGSADQYGVWDTDSNGNYVSSPISSVSGTSDALESIETSFNDDLNGDGVIGETTGGTTGGATGGGTTGGSPTVIESSGTTSLLTDGTHYFLQPAGGAAVEFSYGGAPVLVGQFGAWTPIAAQQTATGYEVALQNGSADQYGVWDTDSSGNYVAAPTGVVSGTSAALEEFETSFNDDLNGDGIIGLPPQTPQFVYQGTDATGAQVYDITWPTAGSQPIAVRVVTPQHPSTDYPHTFLYALPVESGISQSTFGSGLTELANLDVEDQYNATIIEPIFPTDSWYADNPNDPTINYETFVSSILPQWVDSTFDPSGTDKNLLVGFSKSGYGALDLLLKYPSTFDAAAAFDFPADMSSYDYYGTDTSDEYGTQANFQNNYELDQSFIDTYKAPFTTQDRMWISEGPDFGGEVADFDSLLTSQGVMHTLSTAEMNDAHTWSVSWLSNAVAGLYGLEKNLNSGAGA